MCEPTTMMMLAGAALSGGKMYAEHQQAEEMGDLQASQLIQSNNITQSNINAQAVEANRTATQEANASEKEAARVASSARVQSGEAGIAGTGVNRLLGDIGTQASERLAITSSNLKGNISNLNSQKNMSHLNTVNSLKQIDRQTESPSILNYVLNMGAGALSGYTMGQSMFGAAGSSVAGAAGKAGTSGIGEALGQAYSNKLTAAQAAKGVVSAKGLTPDETFMLPGVKNKIDRFTRPVTSKAYRDGSMQLKLLK